MKRILYDIIWFMPATLFTVLMLTSCVHDSEMPDNASASIRVNTKIADGLRSADNADAGDNTFMVLMWKDYAHLENGSATPTWPAPYIAGHAPQPVPFYEHTVYDLRYPYPDDNSYIYAIGYAPGAVLQPVQNDDYRQLVTNIATAKKGRYDFLGCDSWPDVYKGNMNDPFSHDKNKLYFRHLAAKLVFYADRDEATMENRQYVRKVIVTNLQMSINGGKTWTPMYTPSKFEWQSLNDDYTESYKKTIEAVKTVEGNKNVTSKPKFGYKTIEAITFTDSDSGFKIDKGVPDRVPTYGMVIDSCYVCNPIIDGTLQTGKISLKMDISAEMSYHPDFPKGDEGDDGSTTDNLTFTREWKGMIIDQISEVSIGADGKITINANNSIQKFKAGREYRIYLHFYRSGVNLVAQELPWDYGGVHYISISGADPDPDTGETTDPATPIN